MSYNTIKDNALKAISNCKTTLDIEKARVEILGKNGILTLELKKLAQVSPEDRKTLGQSLNIIKEEISAELNAKKIEFEKLELNEKLAKETLDLTIPTRYFPNGKIHPLTQTIEEVVAIFGEMGFKYVEGGDIEEDWYNFTALNIGLNHPARQDHDTFYIKGKDGKNERLVLRTHTSPMQIRTMMAEKPPIRIIVPGRTYRADSDATHSPMFHQVEGLVIDEVSHIGHLKHTLITFLEEFFGAKNIPVRFRPSYFPFTEPSIEVDVSFKKENGQLIIGQGNNWLEILGSGMVNPIVIKNCGLDPNKYQGFAFGMGLERITMLKYGIPDLRTFFESDNRWLNHYGFLPSLVPSLTGGL